MVETTGTLDFNVSDETYQTWYKVVGDLKSGLTPLVLLHGGPGMSHHYVLSHAELYTTHGIPVVFYDQIGIGASTHLPHKPKAFWTLGIESHFDLLGQSWVGLRRLIITNAPASEALWEESMLQHLSKFPQEFQDLVRKHEREGTTSSKEYQDALRVFYNKHTCQVVPWPEDLVVSFKAMEETRPCALGTSEFNTTGTLKTWTVIDRLYMITCPTLVVNDTEEGAQDFVIAPFLEKIPKVKWVKFAKSHCPFW
ncbi:proline-specific peptidase [Imleria badia]|nr:proline-specific peptidase [Imleria badia]